MAATAEVSVTLRRPPRERTSEPRDARCGYRWCRAIGRAARDPPGRRRRVAHRIAEIQPGLVRPSRRPRSLAGSGRDVLSTRACQTGRDPTENSRESLCTFARPDLHRSRRSNGQSSFLGITGSATGRCADRRPPAVPSPFYRRPRCATDTPGVPRIELDDRGEVGRGALKVPFMSRTDRSIQVGLVKLGIEADRTIEIGDRGVVRSGVKIGHAPARCSSDCRPA